MTNSHPSDSQPLEFRPVAAPCPTNQRVGPQLDTLTVKALLALPLTAIAPDESYRFCPAADCPTVYYRADGQQVFGESDLRERVFQKHMANSNSIVCYCFGHTVADVRAALAARDGQRIVANIERGIQAGQCACDIRNPQGRCCLGNTCPTAGAGVRELIDQLAATSPDQEVKHD